MRLSLSNDECKVLYNKYRQAGISEDDADYKLSTIKQHLKEVVKKLESKNKTEEEIETAFRKEFEKLYTKAGVL